MQKINIISSTNNNKINELIKIRDNKKYRDENNLIFLEGERLINDSPKELLICLFVSENYENDLSKYSDIEIYKVTNNVYNKIKDTKTSQGIIAIAKKPSNTDYKKIFETNHKNIILLDNIQDPGNLGTIFRTCEASGIVTIVLSSDCCDAYMPKVLRASMSSIFRINIYIVDDIKEFILYAKEKFYNIIATTLDNNNTYFKYDFVKNNNIVIFGNEANGIKNEILKICDTSIKIPMEGSIESLNVSISCAILLYEIKRQIDISNEK